MALTRVAAASDIPAGSMIEVRVNGQPYAICNVAGELHAVNGACPHRGGPLAHGALHGHMIVCPWHAWEFDCRDGRNDYNPDIQLEKPGIVESRGELFLDIA